MKARSLLDVSIRVLEYFESHAAHDTAAGEITAPQKAEPNLVAEAERPTLPRSSPIRAEG